MKCITFLAVLCSAAAALAGEVAFPALVKPREIRTVVADGKHNAFTAVVRWRGAYWLSFRKGPSHSYGEADLIVLRSPDGDSWSEHKRVNWLTDDRDPSLLATPTRLLLYDVAMEGSKLTSFVTFTDDGKTWSTPQPVCQQQYIFWKPIEHGGRFYATAHLKSHDGKERPVHLITSTDGIEWERISKIRGGNSESETTLHFASDEKMVAFLRQKHGSPQASILESAAPFEHWDERPCDVHLAGHSVYTFDGVTYLFSRTHHEKGTGTMVYVYEDGRLHPYCRIPSGGDCSYPSAVRIGEEMLVSYYSSHEGATNIYTARVPLRLK